MKRIISSLFLLVVVVASAQNSVDITLKKNYLNFPVSYDEQDGVGIELVVDGEVIRTFNIFLPDTDPDFWVFLDISDLKGEKAVLRTNEGEDKKGLNLIYQSDERKYLDDVYSEKHRPQLHFSSQRGWINDPNGLVYYKGEYHLFFQHNPYGYYWGNMHWGHAVSKDLVHWEQLPEAIYQHELGGIFSGSAVVDSANTSGFKNGDNDVLVALYTSFFDAGDDVEPCQNIAYSNDKGRTWIEYEGNPIIGNRTPIVGTYNVRDPRVFWHDETNKWVMVLYERIGHSIFTSDNLKEWEYESHIETFWECPELFELSVDGDPDNKKWVMYGINGDYLLGDFDGKKFIPKKGMYNYIQGKFLAAQTFNNIPQEDGRRIQVGYVEIPGWVDIPSSNPSYNGLMSFPTELTLRTTADGVRMFNEPVKEIENLYKRQHRWNDLTVKQANKEIKDIDAELLHVKCKIDNINAIGYSIKFGEDVLYYCLKKNLFYYNRDVEGAEPFYTKYFPALGDSSTYYEFIVDRTSIEIFVDHGRFTMVLPRKLESEGGRLEFLEGDGGQEISDIKISELEINELNSIWKK